MRSLALRGGPAPTVIRGNHNGRGGIPGLMVPTLVSEAGAADRMIAATKALRGRRTLLAGLSGIDGSGKGYLASRLAHRLQSSGLRLALLNVDGWLNLPARRFSKTDPGGHFYRHGLRLEEMFARLVLPLRDRGEVDLVADFAEETATGYRPEHYSLRDIDVVLVEGIFLFKRGTRPHFDVAMWVDCTFETAQERAIARAQEGLPPEQTIQAYRTIYFPAQRLHAALDAPRDGADYIIPNDPRLVA